ncbi:unnamed protein product [Echinostoma caproni]|uniref:Reverse transcriptase domain-containing protein n=1 Tax=Echinostoma caproni TaxID=27848 RepID=A0A183ADH1_9TREM|nr:unnamed protein product [Echinostoma caproni]
MSRTVERCHGDLQEPIKQRKLPPRSQCIIVVNLPKAEATTTKDRLNHDLQLLRLNMITLFDDDEVEPAASVRVKAAFRLGKPRKDNNPRLLQLVLRVESEAKEILQQTHKLKETPVWFLSDLDPHQRSKLKTALEELSERRAKGETDLCIRHRTHAMGPPWFDRELQACLRQRNKAWSRYYATGSGYEEYRCIRNNYTALKQCKRTRFEERLAVDSVQAPERVYAYLSRRIRATPGLPTLGTLAEKDEDKAEMLASHYASVYTPDSRTLAHPLDTDTQFAIRDVALVLRRLKIHQSPGPDGVHSLILRELADELAVLLCNLFNLSFGQGRLPRQWKDTVIVPPLKGLRQGAARPSSAKAVQPKCRCGPTEFVARLPHRPEILRPCWQIAICVVFRSKWGPQGSVLGPFVVYVNDLPGQLCSLSLMYVNDIKIWGTIEGAEDRNTPQEDFNNLVHWADTWALPVNTAKLTKAVVYCEGHKKRNRIQTRMFTVLFRNMADT